MSIDWKILSFSMIISIFVTVFSGLILSLSNIILAYPDIYEYLQSQNLYSEKSSYTITVSSGYGPPFVLHLWVIIVIGLVCFFVLTIVFYFVMYHLRKNDFSN